MSVYRTTELGTNPKLRVSDDFTLVKDFGDVLRLLITLATTYMYI